MLEDYRITLLKAKLANHAQEWIICKEAGMIEQMIEEEEMCELYEAKLRQLGVVIDESEYYTN